MRVKITKSMFENIDITGEEHEVCAVLEQLGYPEPSLGQPDGDVVEGFDHEWEDVTFGQLKSGDIVCTNTRSGISSVHPRLDCMHASGDWLTEAGTFVRDDMHLTYQRRVEPKKEWEEIPFGQIRRGDVIRTTYPTSLGEGDEQLPDGRFQRTLEAREFYSARTWRDDHFHFIGRYGDNKATYERKVQ